MGGTMNSPTSKERVDGVDHRVLVVDDRDQPPLVEGRAGMRDAARDEVAEN